MPLVPSQRKGVPNYFNPQQQQQPGMFPAIDVMETRVHPVAPYVLGVCCGIGGYFYGVTQDAVPAVIFVAVGFVIGVLLVPLLLKLLSGALAAIIVIIAALLTFWLLQNDAALKHRQGPPSHQAGQSLSYGEASRQLLNRAMQEVQQ
jgi:hypothetical protein